VKDPLLPMNPAEFEKMAHGDPAALVGLASEYFQETRRLIAGWGALAAAGDFNRLRDELHRCKGGASLFGLERLVAFLGQCERASHLETHGFDMNTLETELTAAEQAVADFHKSTS
jgi:HPt (histidine-containing phosphotransfer) domain-containing protein